MLEQPKQVDLSPEAKDKLNTLFTKDLTSIRKYLTATRPELQECESLLERWKKPTTFGDWLGKYVDRLGFTLPLEVYIRISRSNIDSVQTQTLHLIEMLTDLEEGRVDRVELDIVGRIRESFVGVKMKDDSFSPADSSNESIRRRSYWEVEDKTDLLALINPESAQIFKSKLEELEGEYMKNDWGYK